MSSVQVCYGTETRISESTASTIAQRERSTEAVLRAIGEEGLCSIRRDTGKQMPMSDGKGRYA